MEFAMFGPSPLQEKLFGNSKDQKHSGSQNDQKPFSTAENLTGVITTKQMENSSSLFDFDGSMPADTSSSFIPGATADTATTPTTAASTAGSTSFTMKSPAMKSGPLPSMKESEFSGRIPSEFSGAVPSEEGFQAASISIDQFATLLDNKLTPLTASRGSLETKFNDLQLTLTQQLATAESNFDENISVLKSRMTALENDFSKIKDSTADFSDTDAMSRNAKKISDLEHELRDLKIIG